MCKQLKPWAHKVTEQITISYSKWNPFLERKRRFCVVSSFVVRYLRAINLLGHHVTSVVPLPNLSRCARWWLHKETFMLNCFKKLSEGVELNNKIVLQIRFIPTKDWRSTNYSSKAKVIFLSVHTSHTMILLFFHFLLLENNPIMTELNSVCNPFKRSWMIGKCFSQLTSQSQSKINNSLS